MKSQEIVLEAQERKPSTKSVVKTLRSQGRIPGIAYGDKDAPLSLSIEEKSLQAALHSERGRNALITLKVGSSSHAVLVKEIQRNPITRAIRHIDFHRVSLKQKIETMVPLHVKGEAPGVKLGGGVLEHVVRDIRVRCLPTEIPASLDIDISSLQINQSVKVQDLKAPEGVELLMNPENVVVSVVAPTILEEPTVAAAAVPGAAAEPEVIKKGKVEEGEEGAAAPAAGAEKKGAAPAAAAKPEAKK